MRGRVRLVAKRPGHKHLVQLREEASGLIARKLGIPAALVEVFAAALAGCGGVWLFMPETRPAAGRKPKAGPAERGGAAAA